MAITSDEIKEILRNGTEGGDYDDINNPSLTPDIRWSSFIVARLAICSTNKGEPYSSELLDEIQRWLAAHAYAMSDRVYTQRSTLRASGTFGGTLDKYLEFTPYGQQAKLLDHLGCLEALGKTKAVSAIWMGRRPSAQTDVEDRS